MPHDQNWWRARRDIINEFCDAPDWASVKQGNILTSKPTFTGCPERYHIVTPSINETSQMPQEWREVLERWPDKSWRWAAIDEAGTLCLYKERPALISTNWGYGRADYNKIDTIPMDGIDFTQTLYHIGEADLL